MPKDRKPPFLRNISLEELSAKLRDPNPDRYWPYNFKQALEIEKSLGEGCSEDLMQRVMEAARLYCGIVFDPTYLDSWKGPADELNRYSNIAGDYLKAFGRLSSRSRYCLLKEPFEELGMEAGDALETAKCIISSAAKRARQISQGLAEDPSGPKPNYAKKILGCKLCKTFEEAHPDSRRPQGRPQFLRFCIEPLGIVLSPSGLESFARESTRKP
jgi:hypothetical protein